MNRFDLGLTAAPGAVWLLLGLASTATAGTITVNDTGDAYGGATCSLRNAVKSVNTGVAYGGCHFAASIGLSIIVPAGRFRITRPLDVSDAYAGGGFPISSVGVVINGAGADKTVIDANGMDQIFKLSGTGTYFYLNNAQLTGGAGYYGGAIADSGHGLSLGLDRVLLQHNHTGYGGSAIFVSDATGTVTITHSSVADNDSDGYGGSLYLSTVANVTIENTTISGNRAEFVGGVIVGSGTAAASIRLNNVTIADNTGNRADISSDPNLQGGAGLFVYPSYLGSLHIGNSIFARNTAHYRAGGTNYSGDCVGAKIISEDYNLLGFGLSAPCTISGSTLHSYLNADPKLLSLFNYGGHLPTQAIPPDSPAHNNGNPATCASDDERGISRSVDVCDIGAYEFHADFTVNSTLDANDAVADGVCDAAPPNQVCTLRAALDEANAASSARTIVLPAGMYTLTVPFGGGPNRGELYVHNPDATLILGAGANQTRISWVAGRPSFAAASTPALALAHLAITRAAFLGNGIDGTVSIFNSNALLEEISVTGAGNCFGGGVDMNASPAGTYDLRIERSTFAFNRSYGCMGGTNFSSGGGIAAKGANVYIRNSTVSHNSADNFGGGIYATASNVYLSQNTIADNVANATGVNGGSGGGIALDPANGGSFVVAGTLLANNTRGAGAGSADDCAALLASRDENLIGNTAGCTITGSFFHTYQNVDPQLGPLALQGGATMTHGLKATSPALNWIFDGDCVDVFGNAIASDQRGVIRAPTFDDFNSFCDIGAFEGVSDVIFADGFD
jgi:CSLREA domain-containing protein